MDLEANILERVRNYEELSRWERSELGRELRRAGLSYGEIMELIPVKKSTLATWSRDVALTPLQIEAMRERRAPEPGYHRDTNRKRRQEIETLRAEARLEAFHLQADPLWSMGVALYWGEGSKTSRRLEMAHSEPEALRLFILWSRSFHHPDSTFAAAINLHYDNDQAFAKEFWMYELALQPQDFTKTFIKPDGTGHRKNHLATGVCRLRMRQSADAFFRTMEWIDFVKEGFAK